MAVFVGGGGGGGEMNLKFNSNGWYPSLIEGSFSVALEKCRV